MAVLEDKVLDAILEEIDIWYRSRGLIPHHGDSALVSQVAQARATAAHLASSAMQAPSFASPVSASAYAGQALSSRHALARGGPVAAAGRDIEGRGSDSE